MFLEKSLKQRSFNAWLYFGILGLAVYLFMRPIIDFNSNSAITEPVSSVKEKIKLIAEELGVSTDTLAISVTRNQKVKLYKILADSIPYLQSPGMLQKSDVPLTYWRANFIHQNGLKKANPNANVDNFTPIFFEISDKGKVISVKINDSFENTTFFEGDSLEEISENLVKNVFGYDLSNYVKAKTINTDQYNENSQEKKLASSNDIKVKVRESYYELEWQKNDLSKPGPLSLNLKLRPEMRRNKIAGITQSGVSLAGFQTYYVNKSLESKEVDNSFVDIIYFFVGLIILLGFVIVGAVRQILKGMVEWKRGFVVLFVGIILVGSWRGLYLLQTPIAMLSTFGIVQFTFNTLLFSLVIGIYSSLAYMAWESLARKQKHNQLLIIDSVWKGKLFYKETGSAILYGYSLGGVLLGALSVGLFGLQLSYYQFDSQMGYVEATSVAPFITIPLNTLGIAFLGLIGHLGVTSAMVAEWVKKVWLRKIIAIVLTAFFLSGMGRFFGTEGSIFKDFILYLFIIAPLYAAYSQFGLVTAISGWWAFSTVLLMMPFFNPNSPYVIIQFLLLTGVLCLPLIFGFIARYFGNTLEEERVYIPEYEEKLSRQVRFEKEIEIARESQFELLPKNTPELPEAMICGFFIPSFEVGGDYYDYFLKYNDKKEATSLAITVIDVSGKAMKAAMHAVHTSGLILARFPSDLPEQVLTAINPFIFSKTDKKTFITGVMAEYFFESKILKVANAGHCLPILKRNGKASYIETPDPRFPLGIMKDVQYKALDLQLLPGDIVLFYSDGLPEAQNTKMQRFGFENVLTLMEELDDDAITSSDICQLIKRKVQMFSAYQMADDTTIVALKIN